MTFPSQLPFGPAETVTLPEIPLAVIRHSGVRIEDLPALFDVAFPLLGFAIATGGITPAGPALAIYRGDPAHPLDLEIGFPVQRALAEPIVTDGPTIVASTLPGGSGLASTYIGPYDGLSGAWAELYEHAKHPPQAWFEAYVTDPSDTPAEKLRTDIYLVGA